jgi:hypothetical protein
MKDEYEQQRKGDNPYCSRPYWGVREVYHGLSGLTQCLAIVDRKTSPQLILLPSIWLVIQSEETLQILVASDVTNISQPERPKEESLFTAVRSSKVVSIYAPSKRPRDFKAMSDVKARTAKTPT